MLLIADSGGTKTTWAFVHSADDIEISKTKGIHPYFQNVQEISQILEYLPIDLVVEVTEIQFYGAGCGAKEQAQKVASALKNHFPNKAKIEVHTDVFGAARALCQGSAGMAAILGTGSNTCFYDGKRIVNNSRGFGFILGDEGSGAVMGKQLVMDYLYQKVPLHLLIQLEEKHGLEDDELLKNVYQKPAPNRYLAQFSYFIHQHRSEPYIQQLLQSHFEDFFRKRILIFEEHQKLPLHLIGSIAFYFQEEIRVVAANFGIEIGKVLQNPVEGLVGYHLVSG
ncbi:MAG: BadF/BadG/BcrA/BcrD ATPase family protein [Chitinophagales bacterium]